MTNISKQFADLATALRSDLFLKTRLKVAFFYWISILLVVVLFSFLLFFTTRENLQEDTGQTDGANEIENQIEEQVVSKTLNTLLSTIYITDIVILLVAASLSYYVTARTLRPVRDAAEQQNQFISDAAHELRTPLSILKIGFDVLNASPTKSLVEYESFHRDAEEEVDRLIKLNNDLLTLSRNDSLPVQSISAELDLSTLARDSISRFELYAAKRSVDLKSEIEPGMSVHGDGELFIQMVSNIIKNAIEYNRPKGTVLLTLRSKGTEVLLTVKDTGVGISTEDLPHIFDRFYRADPSRSGALSGFGLGLSIVRKIADQHHVRIEVESELGQGTTFTVIFPKS